MKVIEVAKAEAEAIMKGSDFQNFFENGSRMIERALGQEFNLKEDFFAEEDEGKLHKKFVF